MGPLAVVFGATLPTKNPSSSIRSSTRELAVKHSLRAEPIFPFIFVSPAASLIPLFLSGCFYCFLAFLPNLRRSPAWPLLAPSVLTRRSSEKFPSIFPISDRRTVCAPRHHWLPHSTSTRVCPPCISCASMRRNIHVPLKLALCRNPFVRVFALATVLCVGLVSESSHLSWRCSIFLAVSAWSAA
jgi:hypothetical protein